jgi:hypothetical protein
MFNDGVFVKELTLPLLLVSGYSAVRYVLTPSVRITKTDPS